MYLEVWICKVLCFVGGFCFCFKCIGLVGLEELVVIEVWFVGGMCEFLLMWLFSGIVFEIFDVGVGFLWGKVGGV